MGGKTKPVNTQKIQDTFTSDVLGSLVKRLQGQDLSKEETVAIGRYYALSVPKKMYRYRPEGQRELDTLVSCKVWFSLLSELNDPFESNFKVDAKSIIAADSDLKRKMNSLSYAKQQQYIKMALGNVDYDRFYHDILDNYTIACFSEISTSLLMWGHYSSGHRGMCIEYNTLELGEKSSKVVIPVKYTEKLPALSTSNKSQIMFSFLQIMRTKSSDWSYEYEWRCIQDVGACGDSLTSKGALLDSSAPKAVYVGCKADEAFIDSLKTICTDLLSIPLYKMIKSNDEFKLIPKRIN
jgi:hypothetical protein